MGLVDVWRRCCCAAVAVGARAEAINRHATAPHRLAVTTAGMITSTVCLLPDAISFGITANGVYVCLL